MCPSFLEISGGFVSFLLVVLAGFVFGDASVVVLLTLGVVVFCFCCCLFSLFIFTFAWPAINLSIKVTFCPTPSFLPSTSVLGCCCWLLGFILVVAGVGVTVDVVVWLFTGWLLIGCGCGWWRGLVVVLVLVWLWLS